MKGYAHAQLNRDLGHSKDKRIPDDVAEKSEKAHRAAWAAVVSGMASGELSVGSRAPIHGTPVWATPEVVTGGFVTGHLLATLQAGDEPNSAFLTQEGFEKLQAWLDSGCFRIRYPEHGALLSVAWLARQGRLEEAKKVLDAISPFFENLRFYPDSAETPISLSPLICVSTVGEVCEALSSERQLYGEPNLEIPRIRQMEAAAEAIRFWVPFKLRLIRLFGETRNKEGWPLQKFPGPWLAEAELLFSEFEAKARKGILNGKVKRAGSNLEILTHCLEKCVKGKVCDSVRADIQPRKVGLLKRLLEIYQNRFGGLPGSEAFTLAFAKRQAMMDRQLASPSRCVFYDACVERLRGFDPELGLFEMEAVLAPLTVNDARYEIPKTLRRKISRCRVDSLVELLRLKVIPSSESMALLVPRLSSAAITLGIDDQALRFLAVGVRHAFFRRRSLLLLNLASQVKLKELPWTLPFLLCDSKGASLATLKEIVSAALTFFPFSILPNKLLQSLRDLVISAGLEIPLVDELAADIFQGRFSPKFLHAAQLTAEKLGSSIYAEHYGLSECFEKIESFEGDNALANFNELCTSVRTGYSIAENGIVIEQCQLLTSHNLIPLIVKLDLQLDWVDLISKIWRWILGAMSQVPTGWPAKLRLRKDVAYAWRQLVVFTCLIDDQLETIGELKEWERFEKGTTKYTFYHCVETFVKPFEEAFAGNLRRPALRGWSVGNEPRQFFPAVVAPRLFD